MNEMNPTTRMKYPRVLATTLMAAVMMMVMAVPAEARTPRVSEILEGNGFSTLLFALDATGLTSVLDENQVVLFAPTNDVFDDTAAALGCEDVFELADALSGINVGGTDGLTYVLTYHAWLGRVRDDADLLGRSELSMVNGDSVTTGVNLNGLYVEGIENETPSNITTDRLRARSGSSVYAIDQILLPIVPAGICDGIVPAEGT